MSFEQNPVSFVQLQYSHRQQHALALSNSEFRANLGSISLLDRHAIGHDAKARRTDAEIAGKLGLGRA